MKRVLLTIGLCLLPTQAYAICGTAISQSPGIDAPGSYVFNYGQGAGDHTIEYGRLTATSCPRKAEQFQTILQNGEDLRTLKSSFALDDPDRFLFFDQATSPSYFDARSDSTVSANPEDNTYVISRCNVWTVECNATNDEFIVTRSNP